MPLGIDRLRSAAARARPVTRTLREARILGMTTVFLCHSHRDRQLVQGLGQVFNEAGWVVYVDWLDEEMPEVPNRETASRIQAKIVESKFFVFLATSNSMVSRWCPWEIGYADGKKTIDEILIVPTIDGLKTHGSEYLELYRRIDLSDRNDVGVWRPGERQGVLLRTL